ncbi:MAG: TCP-1/cpn60 chaperonin family protein, partial [Myxococcota bacterium]|nr:TCP-1/cpn60 chaperonin family protein [Myxococcota bacterium]
MTPTAPTNILRGAHARRRLVAGANLASRTVGATLGPSGRTVLIERGWAAPIASKDGVTVAREIALDDRHAHMGAMLVLEAARRTVNAAGDGTTATCTIVGEIARRGETLRAAGLDPMALARGIRGAAAEVVTELHRLARPVDETEDVRRVALLASNGDADIARAVADALEAVGVHGVVSIGKSRRTDAVALERSSGLWFDKGWSSAPSLLRPDEAALGAIRIERPLVIVCGDAIASAHGIVSLMEAALRTIKRWKDGEAGAHASFGGLVVVARVEGDARSTLVQNRHAGQLDAVFVEPPWSAGGTDEALDDIAVATGAHVLGSRLGRPCP